MKLPDELFYIPNRDKTFTEKWYPGRNLLNFPASFRAVLFGSPEVGKSSTVKHLILRANPAFTQIFLWHCDGNTKEYDDLGDGVIRLDELPPPDDDCWE